MNLWESLRNRPKASRADGSLGFDDWLGLGAGLGGLGLPIMSQTLAGTKQQEIFPDLIGLAAGALERNGIVFACVQARARLFSEARFQYRPKGSFANGDLYGTTGLQLLEEPWPRASTRDLLAQMSMYEQLAGNAYVWREDANTLRVPRPDWMTIVLGSRRPDGLVGDIDTEVLGYVYRSNGAGGGKVLLPEQVAHFYTAPDPMLPWRGMSWLQPVISEIVADNAATTHKRAFFENGATANTVFTLDPAIDPDEFDEWVEKFEDGHKGARNAYKRIFLGGGADAKVIGADMQQMDFTNTQGHGEARICNAAGIPPIIVGVVKGLDSATYSNYGQAKRVWADGSMRPMWGSVCKALEPLVPVQASSELWYDDRQISFLQEDRQDLAETQQTQASAIRTLIDAGFEPTSAIQAIESGDLSKLVHTGLYSVQLQPPGTTFKQADASKETPAPATGGK